MTETLATLSASPEKLREMLELGLLSSKGDYDKALLRLEPGKAHLFSSFSGVAKSFSTFEEEDYLQTVNVSDADYVEAILNIDQFEFWLDVVADEGNVRVDFKGESPDELASSADIVGGLTASVHIPASNSVRENQPAYLIDRFDDEGAFYHTPEDKPGLDTVIVTDVSEIERIMRVVDGDEVAGFENFPIVVEDGEFRLDIGSDRGRTVVEGALQAEKVEGGDVANLYGDPFKPVFNTLSGEVTLMTTHVPGGGAPLVVYKDIGGGQLRHIISPSGEFRDR